MNMTYLWACPISVRPGHTCFLTNPPQAHIFIVHQPTLLEVDLLVHRLLDCIVPVPVLLINFLSATSIVPSVLNECIVIILL